MVQVNSIVGNFESTFGIPGWGTGIFLTILSAIVIVGGIKSIAKVAEIVIPFMAVFFFLGCLIILLINGPYIGQALGLIVTSAFSTQAAVGGFTGYAVMQAARFGIARGLFSNEAGLGSAPIAAAAAVTRNPVRQGLVSMSQVFWDTIILCAVTGTMYVTCVLKWPNEFIDAGTGELVRGVTFAAKAFGLGLGSIGPIVLTICIFTFAWTTILGWGYYGERSVEYLCGKKGIMPFKVVYSAAVFIGSIMAVDLVFDIADMFNAFMAIPNLISLLALNGLLAKMTKDYLWDKNLDGVDPDPIMEIQN
jgi:AGCS family alanine or glycine:cation symporter